MNSGQVDSNEVREKGIERGKRGIVFTDNSPFATLKSVPISAVKMNDGFWKARMEANAQAGIPSLYRLFKEKGIFDNFIRVYKKGYAPRRGPFFTDSDVYKWVEAVSFALQSESDSKLKDMLDEVIDLIIPAQDEDGYLNTYFVKEKARERLKNLHFYHELYCAGHLFQAAVAHHRATGEEKLLECAIRFADHLCKVFGPGKRDGFSGHPEIEMALVELYRETGKKRYLDLSGFFLDQVGFASIKEVMGHAVRAMYLTCGGADYYAETGKKDFWESLTRQWESMVKTKSYITGGIGSRHSGEAFGAPYELPNEGAYAETCAAIGSIYWNWRMLLITGRAQFADVMERTLYNGFLSGISLSGDRYFYVNPLLFSPQSLFSNLTPPPWNKDGYGNRMLVSGRRKPWYDCTCCPTNSVRMLSSIPGYFFSLSKEGIWIHLYDNCSLDWHLEDGTKLSLIQRTKYPWQGKVDIEVYPEKEKNFSLFLRIPTWCKGMEALVNGERVSPELANGYLRVNRIWEKGDRLALNLKMETEAVVSNKRVAENRGKVALQRGPIVYCFEGVDNPGIPILEASLKIDKNRGSLVDLKESYYKDFLGGIVALRMDGAIPDPSEVESPLYRSFEEERSYRFKSVSLTAIPYYAWANRKLSEMTVWVPYMLY